MVSLRAYLRTKVARRIFGLFLVCAVVPTVTLTVGGYWLVTRELRSQAMWQLSQAGKISGALLLARLHAADGELMEAVQAIQERRVHPARAGLLRGMVVAREGSPASVLLGTPLVALPPVSAKTAAHLAKGRAALLIDSAGAQPRVFLVRALTEGSSSSRLWGEVSPLYLWGTSETEALGPAGVDLCVYSTALPIPLYCSPGSQPRPRQTGVAKTRDGSSETVKGESSLFLGFDFGAPLWTIVLGYPVISDFAMKEFGRTVALTAILGLSLVVLASNILLRQRLDPVAQLEEGTRRLAAGDFGAQVHVSTGDEFEDLATSFNTMAADLREQFELLTVLQRLDREALEGRSTPTIIASSLQRIGELVGCESSIVIARRRSGTASVTLWRHDAVGGVRRTDARVATSTLDEWQGQPPVFEVAPGGHASGVVGVFSELSTRELLVLPLLEHGSCFGAVLVGRLPGEMQPFSPSDKGRMRQLADQVALAISHRLSIERLSEMSWSTLEALARTIDANSPWTAGHSERVTRLARAIGRRLGLGPADIDRLHRGGLLHDVGKIGISPAILDKPGPLTPEEREIVQRHPVVGARILEPIDAFADVIGIVRYHHERFNGSGYPDGLQGREIPFLARVTAVADVYDALVSDRPYRSRWEDERARSHIAEMAGVRFDPTVVEAFLELAASPEWAELAAESRTPPSTFLVKTA